MATLTIESTSEYRNFGNSDAHVSTVRQSSHLRRNSISLRDVAQITRGESPFIRKGVLEKVFDLDSTDDAEDLSQQHSFVYIMLHPRSKQPQSKVFKKFITCMILFDLITFILSTEPSLYQAHTDLFHWFEGVSSIIFAIEYIARLIIVTENTRFGKLGPIRGRIKWMTSFPAVIDLLATCPFFINLATDWKIPCYSYTRILRVMRIVRTDGYVRAFGACYRVIYYNREILYVAVLVCTLLVLVSSVLLYYLRPRNEEVEVFKSIPNTLFTSLLMLTGQDSLIRSSQNMPWYTKMVVGFTGALSVAMFALPVSLLTWGFESEAIRCARKTSRRLKRASTFEPNLIPDVIDDTVDSVNSDEEYLKIIAKETSDDSEPFGTSDEGKKKIKELVERYLKEDTDGSKFSTLSDFLMSNIPYRGEEDMALMVGFKDPCEMSDAQYRVMKLESSVDSIHSKLDSIARMMELQTNEISLKRERSSLSIPSKLDIA